MWKTTGYLAKKHAVTVGTIHTWLKKGYFDKVMKTKGGHFRIWVASTEMSPVDDKPDKG